MISTPYTLRVRAAITATLVAAFALASAAPALAEGNPTVSDSITDSEQIWNYDSAAGLTVSCMPHSDEFRFRFYFNSGNKDAWYNVGHNLYDIASLSDGVSNSAYVPHFCDGTGNGAGVAVANNAGSVFNWYENYAANVYYNHGYKGPSDTIWPGTGSDLPFTKNNNRSIQFRSFHF